MLAWNELLTDLAWHEILHRHFRPLQNSKWITAKWFTHGKQLQEVAVWGKLKKTLLATHFNIFWIKKQAFTRYCHLHEPSLAQQILICCDKKIVFSYSERIPVSFSWLFHYFSFFFCYFTLLIIFTKIILLLLFYYIFFSWKFFYFFMFRDVPGCSGMFRHVPECSMFRVLSTAEWENIKLREVWETFISSMPVGHFRVPKLSLSK